MSLAFDRVSFSYGPASKPVLNNVSFTVTPGEFLGICGRTGSGKTTLLHHMNGLLSPTQGKVSLNGVDLNDKKNAVGCRTEIGMVFQHPERQLFCPTVREDVGFGPRNMGLGKSEVEARVAHALNLVGLDPESILDKSPFELSGGEQRRVAIAGVLAMAPSILVLDEPAAGLDPSSRRSILALLQKLSVEEGLTVVMASHNMDDLAALCTRIVVLDADGGAIIGTPNEVFSNATVLASTGLEQPFVARLAHDLGEAGFDMQGSPRSIEELASIIAGHM